jgi:hypothetical protein
VEATITAAENFSTAGTASKVKLSVFHQLNVLNENEVAVICQCRNLILLLLELRALCCWALTL